MLKVARSPKGGRHAYDPMEMRADSLGAVGDTLCGRQTVAITDQRHGGYTGLCAIPVEAEITAVTCPRCKAIMKERHGDMP
jgi:hypothetical protein